MKVKTCTKCGLEKTLDQYSKCKRSKYNRQPKCKECNKEYREANRDRILPYLREYYKSNKELYSESSKKWAENNADRKREIARDYYHRNKDKIKAKYVDRVNTDPVYKLKETIKKRFYGIIGRKSTHSEEVLGCTMEEFKNHIEAQFESWMNWDNYGKYNGEENYGWVLDHIIPISSAKTEEDVYKLNHWSNFQPLCRRKNSKKGAKEPKICNLEWTTGNKHIT